MWSVVILNTIQYNTIQYNTIQYNTIQYNTIQIQYNTIQYNTIQYNTIQYNTIQYNTIQYNTIQYNTIQYNTIQYNTIQEGAILWRPAAVRSSVVILKYTTYLFSSDSVRRIRCIWFQFGQDPTINLSTDYVQSQFEYLTCAKFHIATSVSELLHAV